MSKPDSDQYQRIDNSQADPTGISGAPSEHELTSVATVPAGDDPLVTDAAGPAGAGVASGGSGSGSASSNTAGSAATETGTGTGGNTTRVNVRTLTGQQIECDLPTNARNTVADIKAKVEELQGVPPAFQRLIFSGRELQDAQLLSEAGIQHTNVVHLVLRQNAPAPNAGGAANAAAAAGAGGGGAGAGGPILIPILAAANMPAYDPARVLQVQQLARIVKLFSVVDGMFLLVWSLSITPLLAAVALCAAGYYGATKFRVPYVALYMLYLLGSIGFRVYWMASVGDESRSLIVLLVLGILVEVYIMSIVWKFLKLLRQLTPADISELLPHDQAIVVGAPVQPAPQQQQ